MDPRPLRPSSAPRTAATDAPANTPKSSNREAGAPQRLYVDVVGAPTAVRTGAAHYLASAGMRVRERANAMSTENDHDHRVVFVLTQPRRSDVFDVLADDHGRRVVVVLERVVPGVVAGVVAAGAHGVVDAAGDPRHLVSAVRAAAAGYVAFPVQLAREVLGSTWPADVPQIAPEDVAVMRHLARGAAMGSVAKSAGVSERELQRRLAALYAKLGVRSRIEAAVFLAERGMLEP